MAAQTCAAIGRYDEHPLEFSRSFEEAKTAANGGNVVNVTDREESALCLEVLDLDAVNRAICRIPGIEAVHDLHVWTLTSGFLAMSGHATIADLEDYRRVLGEIHDRMHETFGITHVTVQLDPVEFYTIRAGHE